MGCPLDLPCGDLVGFQLSFRRNSDVRATLVQQPITWPYAHTNESSAARHVDALDRESD
jgi:hypothetical protein